MIRSKIYLQCIFILASSVVMFGCTQTTKQSPSTKMEHVVEHIVIDQYSYNPEVPFPVSDNHEVVEAWYSPTLGGRLINSVVTGEGKEVIVAYGLSDHTNQKDYFFVAHDAVSGAEVKEEYISELPANWYGGNGIQMVALHVAPVWRPDLDWVRTVPVTLDTTLSEDSGELASNLYTVTVRTEDDDSGWQSIERYTIDATTKNIQQLERLDPDTNVVFETMKVRTREIQKYDPSFITLDGWQKDLPKQNLPIEKMSN